MSVSSSSLLSIFIRVNVFIFSAWLGVVQADTLVKHSQGETQIPETLSTVLTYDLATLDTLDALNIEIAGLPKGILPERFQKYGTDKYTSIGSLFEPDYEVVASLQPDLIIVANRSSKSYKNLSKLAPTVDLTVWGDGFIDQFKSTTRMLGKLFGKTNEVEKRLNALDKNIERTQALAKKTGKSLIIMTNGGKLSAYGADSRFGWLHNELGLEPAVTDLKKGVHGDPVSFEYLLETDPDVLFVIDRDGAVDTANGAARATLDNDLMKRTKAYKNNRIIYLDSSNWYIMISGLSTVEQMVNEVANGLSH